ncbi:MAG: class C sortase [Oscillospiraceae bacterium]|nr:class C sortase [Oscillospiraceae bacterium]MCR4760343.1 class C sortase [Oscillospiraceae bacterium]
MRKKKASEILLTLALIFVMLLGIAIFLYPAFSNWWNEQRQTRVIDNYNKAVGVLDTSEKEAMLEQAHAYNSALAKLSDPFAEHETIPDYSSILDVPGTGIIGYIDIPKIGVHLPVYHGTSPEVLNIAVGHLEGTSLPVGGAGCHSVISAHRGLPSAKLFTELDQLTEDDQFSISILDDIFTYEVDKISVVLPYETDALRPEPGKDLVTLMTCTPYGINTHRLLVRGHRIDTVAAEDEDAEAHRIRIPADAILIDNMTALPFLIVPLAVILIIYWSLSGKRSGKRYHSAYTVQKELDEKGKDG